MDGNDLSAVKQRSEYFYLAIAVFAYAVNGYNAYIIQPIMPNVMTALHINEAQAGLLISAVVLPSLFLSIPFGLVLGKTGVRMAGLSAVALMACGTFLGALTRNYYFLLVFLMISGTGGAMISVVGPHMITRLFEDSRRATAMCLFNVSQTIAVFAVCNLAPRITSEWNIGPVWWVSTFLGIASAALWLFFIHDRITEVFFKPGEIPSGLIKEDARAGEVFRNAAVWQLSASIFFYMFSTMSMVNFMPSYLAAERGMSLTAASFHTGISSLVAIGASVGSGMIADRIGTRKWVYFAIIINMVLLRVIQIVVPDGPLLYIIIYAQGLTAGGIGLIQASVPYVCKPEHNAIALSLINTGSRGGMAASSALFGLMVASFGYNNSYLIMAALTPVALIGMMTVKGIK